MATNKSFGNFGSFSRLMNNSTATAETFDHTNLALTLKTEHDEFVTAVAKYDTWASSTLLCDSISPLTNIKFSQLFTTEIGESGQNVVVFNPLGTNGTSWSKNESGFVNALLSGFGTQRYSTLLHNLHERVYDKSLVIEHNVRSVYNEVDGRWVRFNWSNRRFVQDTPNPKSSAGVGWIVKHTELDRLILAVVGGQQIRYNFFNEIAWNRFQTNVMDNMNSLVVDVVTMIGNFAQGASDLRKIERNQEKAGVTQVTANSVVVDGIDLKTLTGTVKVEIKMKWSDRSVVRPVNVQDAKGIAFVANTLADKDCEYVKLVQ